MIPQPVWEDPELFVEAILGWRAWHLRRTPDGPVLVPAATGGGVWPARRPFVARCRRNEAPVSRLTDVVQHVSPSLRCTCGIYASDTLRSLVDPHRPFPPLPVLGTVSLWGKVIEHRRGWRAGFAYPDRLRLVCGACLSAGDGAGIPERVVEIRPRSAGGYPRVEPLCAAHLAMRNPSGTRVLRRAHDVQLELLSRYAVDLLPFETIRSVFERNPVPGPRLDVVSVRTVTTVPAPVTATPSPSRSAPDPRVRPMQPHRTRALAAVRRIAGTAFTALFWVVVAWWGCSDSIVTVEGP